MRSAALSCLLPLCAIALCGCWSHVGGNDETGDTAGSTAFTDISAEVSPVVTTSVHVRWTTETSTDGRVEYGPADGSAAPIQILASPDAGTDHEALIFGLAVDTAYTYRVGGTVDGETAWSGDNTVTTGDPPTDLPDITPTVVTDEAGTGFTAIGIISTPSYAVILDGKGAPTWWFQSTDPLNMITRVVRARDGRSVLLASSSNMADPDPDSLVIQRVSFDGTEVTNYATPGIHHDFVELADGTLAYLALDVRTVDDEAIRGDKLMELLPDGSSREVWTCWDWYTLEDIPVDYQQVSEFVHANIVRYDEANDQYWVSLRNMNQIVRIDRASGDIVRKIGGTGGSYAITSGAEMLGQHGFTILPDGFVVHDNRVAELASRAVQYTMDEAAGTMAEVWSYVSPDNIHVVGLGDAIRQEDGNTRIVWSSAGQVDEVTPEGEVLWQMNLDPGFLFGYGEYTTDPQVWP